MEPWEAEWYHRKSLEERGSKRPVCVVCGLPVRCERVLDLEGVGYQGVLCQRCLEGNMKDVTNWEVGI